MYKIGILSANFESEIVDPLIAEYPTPRDVVAGLVGAYFLNAASQTSASVVLTLK